MYREMAKVYDVLMKDAPYDQWVQFTEFLFNQTLDSQPKHVLDLGCGTGQITTRLAQHNYQLTGVDLSSDMLSEASSRAIQDGISVQWLNQDMTRLDGLNGYDAVISYCDVINYITDESQVRRAFKSAYEALHDRGLFVFDVHSLSHVNHDLANQVFSEVYDNLAYIWFCQPGHHSGEVFHDLTFFIQDGDAYHRVDEMHHQRTYSIDDYLKWLNEIGFSKIDVYKDFEFEPMDKEKDHFHDRLFFACYK